MRKKAKEIPEMGNARAVKVATAVVTDLAYVTPVDESTALSNWQVQLNSPASSAIRAFFTGSKGSTKAQSAQAAVEDAKRVLKNKKPGEKIYLSNLVPYIGRLNDGSSTQEPKGFVERAVLVGRLTVRGKI